MTIRPAIAQDQAAYVRPSRRVGWVAEQLDLDESEVYRMVRNGVLAAHGHGIRGVRVFLDSVQAYQEAKAIVPTGTKPTPQKPTRSAVGRAAHGAALTELRKSGILP